MKRLTLLVLYLFTNLLGAQDILETINSGDSSFTKPALNKEKILKISRSKRIFILSNTEDSFANGDYITMLIDDNLIARALVARVSDSDDKASGVKIVKIYSQKWWEKLFEGTEIDIIRGDDSYYLNLKKKLAEQQAQLSKDASAKVAEKPIDEEPDLYNETDLVVEDDEDLEGKNQRAIKPDNIVSLQAGLVTANKYDGTSGSFFTFYANWAYQLADNIWSEFSIGQNSLADYPSPGIDTTLTTFNMRVKYSISLPFYSYALPYVGYSIKSVKSPSAGVGDNISTEQKQQELDAIEELGQSEVIYGVTILKRLVPGWFFRADIGNDIVGVGLAFEF